jgi:cell division protein FtsZ
VGATGIEQTLEMAEEAARPFALAGSARGPVRPAAAPARGAALAPVAAASERDAVPEPAWTLEPARNGAGHDRALELNGTGGSNGFAGHPLAVESESEAEVAYAADAEAADALDLQLELDEGRATSEAPIVGRDEPAPPPRAEAEELLLADRLAGDELDAAPRIPRGNRATPPVSRLGGFGTANVTVSGPGYSVSTGNGGSTLFERMANLSRTARPANAPAAEQDDDGDGPTLSIPRFLGRQNNQ